MLLSKDMPLDPLLTTYRDSIFNIRAYYPFSKISLAPNLAKLRGLSLKVS